MTNPPVLALPNFSLPFTLEADACDYGIGAVLTPKGRPIAFISKAIGPKSAALSTYDKEAMAILEALKKWKHYFLASSLVIKTDQQSLKYIQEQKLTEGIQYKLLIKLLGYNYMVEYKKGSENRVADALSRVKHNFLSLITSAVVPVWVTEVVKSYELDPKCLELIQQLTINPQSVLNYTFSNGVLRYKNKLMVGSTTELRTKLIEALNNSEIGGHSGEQATYQRVKMIFHWPGMKQQVVEFLKQCPTCQINKAEHTEYPGLLQPLPVPEFAWTHISMDFVEGLPTSKNKDMILVVVDRFTKYAHFISMKHPINVHSVARAFRENIFKLHGLPTVMVTDRDRIFTSILVPPTTHKPMGKQRGSISAWKTT